MAMKVRFWKQHSMETCGIACTLMALDAFGIDYPTVTKEQQLYARYRTKAAPGTEGAAIACALAKHGLEVTLAVSGDDLMEADRGYYTPEMHAALLDEQHAWLERSRGAVRVETNEVIDAAYLREQLAGERLVIAQVIIPGDADGLHDRVLHGVLLYGAEGEDFLLCDPLQGKRRLPAAELMELMDTPVGRMAISVGRKAEA